MPCLAPAAVSGLATRPETWGRENSWWWWTTHPPRQGARDRDVEYVGLGAAECRTRESPKECGVGPLTLPRRNTERQSGVATAGEVFGSEWSWPRRDHSLSGAALEALSSDLQPEMVVGIRDCCDQRAALCAKERQAQSKALG